MWDVNQIGLGNGEGCGNFVEWQILAFFATCIACCTASPAELVLSFTLTNIIYHFWSTAWINQRGIFQCLFLPLSLTKR